ncbi:hypothetical protein [Nocardia alni]|uniref:hypothetical protein n=1 Tax=Nocardia alni TaxID=2815723 RepID=UPI001C22C67E|nr:hypothetical protein [Nocardia alni]
MIVSVDIRIASMLSALSGTIVPALEKGGFAAEQAQLLAGHLQVLRTQSEFSDEYETLEHRYTRRLAQDVIETAEGGPQTTKAVIRIRALLDKGEPVGIAAVREAHTALCTAVADFVAAEGEDGTDESVARTTRIVLRAEHEQSLRNRSFFSSFGYEDSSADIQPIDRMMADFRSKFPAKDGASA